MRRFHLFLPLVCSFMSFNHRCYLSLKIKSRKTEQQQEEEVEKKRMPTRI
jgi:hypothetical protein